MSIGVAPYVSVFKRPHTGESCRGGRNTPSHSNQISISLAVGRDIRILVFGLRIDSTKVSIGVAPHVSGNRRPHRERSRRGDADAWGCEVKTVIFVNPGPRYSKNGGRPLCEV